MKTTRLLMGFLVLGLLLTGLQYSPAQAQITDCGSGFVLPNCANELDRMKSLGCVVEAVVADECDSNGKCSSEPVQPNETCVELKKDLNACADQCVPKVTNGSILPGPTDGASARSYMLGNFLPNLTNSFLVFNMIVGVLVLMIAGFMWIFSSGNPDLAEKARTTVIWTVIGLAVGVISYLVVQIVININFFV